MFSDVDVAEFLDSGLDHLVRFHPAARKPFDNDWHGGTWADEAREILSADPEESAGIEAHEIPAFMAAIERLAEARGYFTGGRNDADDADDDWPDPDESDAPDAFDESDSDAAS